MKRTLTKISDKPTKSKKENIVNTQSYFSARRIATTLLGVLALAFCVTIATPTQSEAGTAANAIIRNVVKVDYKDAGGNGSFATSATTTVSVTLLAAIPTITDPTPASNQFVESSAVQGYAFTLFSNANGTDTYNLTLADGTTGDAGTPVSKNKYIVSYIDPQGITHATGNTTTTTLPGLSIGATVILSDNDNDTVNIPAGTMNTIANDDYVVINGIVYKVRSHTDGTVAGYNSGTNSLTPETHGTIRLYQADGTTAADFSAIDLTGSTISQRYIVNAAVTAVADAASDAVLYFNLSLASTTAPNPTGNKNDTKTTFRHTQVAVTKTANPASGKPGDTIEYTIAVTNSGTGDATHVMVTDAVPAFTTLVSGGYNSGAAFAQIVKCDSNGTSNCGTPINITPAVDASENTLASGNAPAATAGSAIKFFLGTGNDGAAQTGGTVAPDSQYQIKYKVTIN